MTDAGSVVVTGGNRGIGREVCRQLAARGHRVVLCARDLVEGERVAAELMAEGGVVEAARLDVADPASVEAFAAALAAGPPIDALVNNAGIALDGFDVEVVKRTLAVNLHGPLAVTDALTPRLAAGARVAMVSSGLGELSVVAPPLRRRFADPALDRAGVLALADEFIAAVAAGDHRRRGWPSSAYSVSKLCLNALVRALDREQPPAGGLRINAVCPGWVRTDMGGSAAPRGVEEGADTVVWAVTELTHGGGIYRDRAPADW